MKALGLRPRAFICFLVFGNPDETLALVFEILLHVHAQCLVATLNKALLTLQNLTISLNYSSEMGAVGAGGNLNLLLAAAVAGAQTDDDNSSGDDDRERDPLTLDDAMELWNRHKTRQGEEEHEAFLGADYLPGGYSL